MLDTQFRVKRTRGSNAIVALARLALSFLFAVSPIFAQLHSLDVSQYTHTAWTAQQGYFTGINISNHAIAQTTDGYIWILTSNGLVRFDGVRFVDWKSPNADPFLDYPSSQLLASKDGSLWIAGRGVRQLRADGTWHSYPELKNLSQVRLAEDKHGVIWAGGEGTRTPDHFSLFRIDHGKVTPFDRPELTGLTFTPLFVDREGRLWVDSEKGIWQILPGPPKLVQKKTLRSAILAEDDEGTLLYDQVGELRKLSPKGVSEVYVKGLQGHQINAVLRDKGGALWIGIYGKGILHLHEGHLDYFSTLDGLSSDAIESIFEDHEGNVWVTSPDSLDEFTKPAVPRLTHHQGLSGDVAYSVLTDRSRKTWIGTPNGFSELIAGHVVRESAPGTNSPGLAMAETHSGSLFMTTQSLDEMVPAGGRHVVRDATGKYWLEGYGNIFSLAEDNEETLWAVSQQLGLLHLRENGDLIEAFKDPRWGGYAYSVAFDPKLDGIWFTTHNGKVFFLKHGKILERYGQSDGLSGSVRVIQVDDDGGIWLSGQSGLAHLLNHQVSVLGSRNGLPCTRVFWMQQDQDHQVWLYTECGLVSFSDADLSSWIADPSHHIAITQHLDNTDGVENIAISGWYIPQHTLTNDGRILFAMRTGLGVLDPLQLNQNVLPPPVYVETISADGHEYRNSKGISLPPKTGSIHIAYTALSFAAPRKVLFRYKLQGFDEDWSPPVTLREVTYTNLPPKHYQFQVIACNNDGVWNNVGATLDFSVSPSWYQTLWFRALAIIALLILLSALYLIRVGLIEREMSLRFEERMGERMRIAREIHDTLLQSLQGLVLSFSNFSQQVTAAPEVREEIEYSLDVAEQLVISGRERIRDLRHAPRNAWDFFTALSATVDEASRKFGASLNVIVQGISRPLQESVQDEALWIVKEALANVRQHAEATSIQLLVAFQDDEFRIAVQDNGGGICPDPSTEPNRSHFGLLGMRERADAIGGLLRINSSPGEGTSVELAVKGKLAYKHKQGRLKSYLRIARRGRKK
ncbi:MAG: triple tyrosine motif-containing protein [Acidobacteriaceae bacterium]